MPCMGEGEGDHGRCELGVPQGALDEPGMHPGVEEMGGVGMPEGREGHAGWGDAGPVFGLAEGAWTLERRMGEVAEALCFDRAPWRESARVGYGGLSRRPATASGSLRAA